MAYYTRKGDDGTTGLLGKGRFEKSDPVFAAIGDVDELNSAVGLSLYYTRDNIVRSELRKIQNELFVIGANMASLRKVKIDGAKLNEGAEKKLESAIADMERRIPKLKKFVIPGGCEAAVHLHMARSVARRAERNAVAASKKRGMDKNILKYLNRLSSYLFVAALYLNFTEGIKESHPAYTK